MGTAKKQRKPFVDTESGSIRLHRSLLFDPPYKKMKDTRKEEKSQTMEDQPAGKRQLKQSLLERKFESRPSREETVEEKVVEGH